MDLFNIKNYKTQISSLEFHKYLKRCIYVRNICEIA